MSRFLKAIWESVPRGAGRHGHTRTWSASRCNTDSDTRQATLPGTFSRSGNDMPPRHRRNDGYCPHNSMPSSTISCCPTAYRRRPTLSDSSQRSRSSSANGGGTLTSSLVTLQGRLVHVEGGKPDAIHRNVSEEELSRLAHLSGVLQNLATCRLAVSPSAPVPPRWPPAPLPSLERLSRRSQARASIHRLSCSRLVHQPPDGADRLRDPASVT